MGRAPFLQSLLHGVLRFRGALLIILALATGAAIWTSQTVGFASEVEIWFLDDDPELVTYRAFLETFQTDELVVVGVFAEDVFAPSTLDSIDRLTEALSKVKGVRRVRSLSNARRFVTEGDSFTISPLFPRFPVTASQAASARDLALADPLIRGTLTSLDARAASIVVELSDQVRSFDDKVALVRALQVAAEAHCPPGAKLRLAGTPIINEAVLRYSQRDFTLLGALSVLLMLVISYLMFRRISAALLPLGVVIVAVLWVFGVMGWLELNLNLVSQSLTVVIFAVGIADSIHVIAEYQHQLAQHPDPKVALTAALEAVVVPCFFTSVTTAAGMLSLTASHLAPVREFGLLAAVGVGFAMLLSFTLLPALLSFTRPPSDKHLSAMDKGPMQRGLQHIATLTQTRRRLILFVFAAVVVSSAALLPQLKVGANPAAYFKYDDPVRQDMRRVDQALGGSTSIEMLVTSKADGLYDPEVIQRLDDLQRWLEALPSVAKVASVTDGLRAVQHGMTGQDGLPKTAEELAQAYLLLEDEPDFSALVTPDYGSARVSARVRMSEAAALVSQIPKIDAKLAEEFSSPELTVRPTGFVKLISEMEMYIVDAQVRSFALAFGLISLLMILMLRSFKLGLLSMIPNIGPVVVGLAIMVVLGIQLDPGTAMLGSLTLGLVVDDTVHMTSRIRHHLVLGLSTEAAVRASIVEVGRALTITSATLAAGFGVLALGSFTPNIYLGIMAAVVITLALLADLFVLPAALMPSRSQPPR